MIFQLFFPKGNVLDVRRGIREQIHELLQERRHSLRQFSAGMHAFSTRSINPRQHDALLEVKEDGTAVAYLLAVNDLRDPALKIYDGLMEAASIPTGIIRLPQDEQMLVTVIEVAPGEPYLFSVILYLPVEAQEISPGKEVA